MFFIVLRQLHKFTATLITILMTEEINAAVKYILSQTDFKPKAGIILGTGLGALVNDVDIHHTIRYSQIPYFPVSTVEGHSGRLIFGTLSGTPVVVMQGRFHFYEGYSMRQVTFPVRVMKMLGIEKLYILNAAGGLNSDHKISDIMIINDHINLLSENPLTGKNLDELGPRFPDMNEPYDLQLIGQAMNIATKLNIKVHQGVYVAVQGPNLETKAEYNFLRIIGADAVGMSTVPENIVARHMNIPVFALSVITDVCTPANIEKVTVEKVIAAAKSAEPAMTRIINALVALQSGSEIDAA